MAQRSEAQPAAQSAADPVGAYETAMKELEDIVARMERGELKLEESLQMFERGMALTEQCRKMLESAELKVKNLLEKSSTPVPPAE
jgi:exodeoxyribonuclease VII small subunit